MTRHVVRLVLLVAFGLVLSAADCATACGPVGGRCTSDLQCQTEASPTMQCNLAMGYCVCTRDPDCGPNEFCNLLGRCQSKVGCTTNADCDHDDPSFCANQFCDTLTSQCISNCECDPDSGELCCTLDSHCPFGSVCNTFEKKCEPGCRDDADCTLGQGCEGAGLGGAIGQCAAGYCSANNLCDFGQICNLESGECADDDRGPYCLGCSGGVASTDCGHPANYCLTDSTDPAGQTEYCGVDCIKNGGVCPFGYECHNVIVFGIGDVVACGVEACVAGLCSTTGGTCGVDEDCPQGPPGGTCRRGHTGGHCALDVNQDCSVDADCCENAGECPEGSCLFQECRGGEGDAFGICACTRDSDCPNDSCRGADLSDPGNPRPGNCEISGHDCYEQIDCEGIIACVDGGCRIGANCAPANDRNCREIAGPTASGG